MRESCFGTDFVSQMKLITFPLIHCFGLHAEVSFLLVQRLSHVRQISVNCAILVTDDIDLADVYKTDKIGMCKIINFNDDTFDSSCLLTTNCCLNLNLA